MSGPGPVTGRSTGSYLPLKAEALAEKVDHVMEANETVGTVEDSFWTGMGVLEHVGNAAKSVSAANEVRLGAGAAGALAEIVHPTPGQSTGLLRSAAGALGEHAEGIVGAVDKVLESPIGRVAEKGLLVAGVASVVYNGYKGVTDDTFKTTGGKVVNGLAAAGVAAAGFISGPVGLAVMGTEVITGGGVSGTVKGMVALGEGMWTGDKSALEKWKADAKSGEHGWLVKAVANNKTASKIAGAVGEVAVGTVVGVAKGAVELGKEVGHAAVDAYQSVSSAVSSGWNKLLHAW